MRGFANAIFLAVVFLLSGCGGSSGGSSPPPPPPSATVVVSGKVTFDRVPHQANGIGLDYANTFSTPARFVRVRAVGSGAETLATSFTNALGDYSVTVPANQTIRIEAVSEMSRDANGLAWSASVVSQRPSNTPYLLQGAMVNSGATGQTRNLHASSGWSGTGYSGTRAAAPFAILDSLYKAYAELETAGVQMTVPSLVVDWRPSNSNTSFYNIAAGYIEILGAANSDTDEYDEHIILHEWWHFFEQQIGRGDVIGGSHNLSARLEIRTAYSEGMGNVFAALVLDDPLYKDALGFGQQNGFILDVAANPGLKGWFGEGSAQHIAYHLIETASMSLPQLFSLLRSDEYRQQTSLTSIYGLRTATEEQLPQFGADINSLVQGQEIFGTGYFGEGETTDVAPGSSLPHYREVSLDGGSVTTCSHNRIGAAWEEYNRPPNRQLVRMVLPVTGSYRIRVERVSGATTSDPDFLLYRAGTRVAEGQSALNNLEQWTGTLSAAHYVLDVHDYYNVDNIMTTGGLVCFGVTLETL